MCLCLSCVWGGVNSASGHGLRRIIALLGKDLRLYRQSLRGQSPREKKVSTLLHSGMGIGPRATGKPNPRSETSSKTLTALSFCLGSLPLHFISAPSGPVHHQGGNKRKRSSICFPTVSLLGGRSLAYPCSHQGLVCTTARRNVTWTRFGSWVVGLAHLRSTSLAFLKGKKNLSELGIFNLSKEIWRTRLAVSGSVIVPCYSWTI